MKMGVLIGANLQVKSTWAIMSGLITVPVEDGDEIMTTAMDDRDPAASTAQASLLKLRIKGDALQFRKGRAPKTHHRIIIPASEGNAALEFHYRIDGQIVERQKNSENKLIPSDRVSLEPVVEDQA